MPDKANAVAADGIDPAFVEAIKMIASLPLSKAEKAEAVRLLLAEKGASK